MGTPYILVTATTLVDALPINPNGETVVDLQVRNIFHQPAPFVFDDGQLIGCAYVLPGNKVGDQLSIRLRPHPHPEAGQGAVLLRGVGVYVNALDATAGGAFPPVFQEADDVEGNALTIGHDGFVLLYWTGTMWQVISKYRANLLMNPDIV